MFDNIKKIDFSSLNKEKEVLVIEPAVVDHCNLNCAYCDHLTPLATKGFYDVKQFEKDFKYLSKVLNLNEILSRYKIVFQIVGGEPFLHPQLMDFLYIIAENFDVKNISQLAIMTNCTMFKNRMDLSEKYREFNKKYGIGGFIHSHYKPFSVSDIKRDSENFTGHLDSFFTPEDHETFDKVNLDFNNNTFPKVCPCCALYMRDGKMCRCPIIGNAKFLLRKLNLPESLIGQDNFITLDENLKPKDILRINNSMSSFCKYCKQRDKGQKWRLSSFDVSEWLDKDYINYIKDNNI